MSDRRLRRDVAWNLVPVVLLGAVGLGLNFLIAAWWGAAALGVFNLVTITYFVFVVIGACGIQFSVLRAVAAHVEDRDQVAAIVLGALVPTVVIALATTGLFLLVRRPIAELLGGDAIAENMLWATPGLFCFAINKVLFGVVNGLRRMRTFAVYTSLRYLLIAAGLGIARTTDVRADHLAVIWTFAEGTLLLVLLGDLLATVKLVRGAGDWRRWTREHLDYGIRGVSATLLMEINAKLDIWMLGAAGVAKELVGVYSLAAALNEGATQLSVVVQNNLNPIVARALAEPRFAEVEELAHRTRRWFVPLMALACTIGATCFPVIVPRLVNNPVFHAGALPFAVLMAGLALASPYLAFNQILLMAGRPGWYTLFISLVVGINFVANVLLIPHFGLLGAALANATAAVASALLTRRFARGRIGVKI
ncbi:MAG TPA: polysaccharide biosynthesis C-terminal domain-containing protein [Kofleriaceae bacterium]|nr:polysaccharide biosynthesis C-terminal domain-containing protein [Kofleriaceae bacterium]